MSTSSTPSTPSTPSTLSTKKRRIPVLESLESRRLLTTSVWTGAAGDHLYTDGANWVGGVAPAPGNDINFPALSTAQTVDVNVASIVGNVSISGTYTITDQTLTVNGNVESNASATAVFSDTIAPANAIHFTADTSSTLTLGTISDTSADTLDKFGAGVLLLAGNSQSTWQLLAGTMTVEVTTQISVSQFAGTLNGAGSVKSISDNGAVVSPGSANPMATLTSTNNTFFNGGTLAISIQRTTRYSSLTATSGPIDLTNSPTLSVAIGTQLFTAPGATYDILHNNTGAAIVGTFAGLAQGAQFTSGGEIFTINYSGGTTGHDVVLTTDGAASNLNLQSSVTTGLINEPVTLTATVTGINNAPTGSVTFFDNGTAVATVALVVNTATETSTATFSSSKLKNGSNTFTASYTGDANFVPSTSNAVLVNLGRVGPIFRRPAAAVRLTAKAVTLSAPAIDTTTQLADSLIYTWSVVKMPSGAKTPIFTVNGTKSATTTTALFTKDGTYHFRVTVVNSAGRTITSDVDYLVRQYPRDLRITPHSTTVVKGGTIQFNTIVLDQFDHPLRTPVGVPTYSVFDGDGTITGTTGIYTAGQKAGPVTIAVTLDDLTGTIVTTIV